MTATTAPPLLLAVLRQPRLMAACTLADWDLLLRQAISAQLLATLHDLADAAGVLGQLPPQPRAHLDWAHRQSERHRQAVRWEVRQIRAALAGLDLPLILLKGAAYAIADLPPARGRLFSDIDIMVPKPRLPEVEAALMLHGWAGVGHDAYDQRYYRNWMHELPPLQHIRRLTVIDVHHAILPETAAARPDPLRLRRAAVAIPGQAGLQMLAPVDLVLHSATHLFYDGELAHGLRDLVDIHRLLSHYGDAAGFWSQLTARAAEIELERPLYYALRYAARLLHTTVPADTSAVLADTGPPAPLLRLMDALFLRALLPDHASCADRWSGGARYLLYLRANWLRMPLPLLARHLFHKAFISPRHAPAEQV